MKHKSSSVERQYRRNLSFLISVFLIWGLSMGFVINCLASDEIRATVLEIGGSAESKISGEKTEPLRPGHCVKIGEELHIREGSWVVLILADSTVRRFNGPSVITIEENMAGVEGNTLARLGSAIVQFLFAQDEERVEGMMATRTPENVKENRSYFPILLHPAPGSSILNRPTKFKWRKVEGVPLYRLSIYSWDRLMWQGTTSDSEIECSAKHCNFQPGEQYYWLVEALIGNSSLRSKVGEFKILPGNVRMELQKTLADPKLSLSSKIRLCLGLNLYDKALDLFDSQWKGKPLDRDAYLLRAEIREKMGLLEDAFLDYKNALNTLPAE